MPIKIPYKNITVPVFHAHRNGVNQGSIVTATWTKIKFTHKDFDTSGDFLEDADDSGGASESRLTPKVAGKYLITAQLVWNVSLVDQQQIFTAIRKNGASVNLSREIASGTDYQGASVSAIVEANGVDDYFEIFGYHSAGSNRSALGTASETYFEAHLINPALSVGAGPIYETTVTKTIAYTSQLIDGCILCDATGGAFTVTLLSAVNNNGKIYTIKKIDVSANAITVDGDGSETIDGATTKSLASQYDYIQIQSDGANWNIIG